MQKRIRVICILWCYVMTTQIVASADKCAEYIDIEAINKMDLVMNHAYALTGSGTFGMPGTGSGTMAPCTGSGTIGGVVYTQFNEPIESVLVEIESMQSEYPKSRITESNGLYTFQNEPFGYNYSIRASRDFDVYNGLSTLDVVQILQIIYGLADDLSPYSYLAADVNQDQDIDIEDALQLVQLLIGETDAFEGSASWVFIDANQEFVNNQSPWPYVDRIDLRNLASDILNNDFIGVKLGDVSGDADPSELQRVQSRYLNQASVSIKDQFLKQGQSASIRFYSTIDQKIDGIQLFLDYQNLKIQQIKGAKLNEEFASVNIQKDYIFMSWFGNGNQDHDYLFSIDVIAEHSGYVSDFIQLNKNWLPSEMYVENEADPYSIEFSYVDSAKEEVHFSVSQNYPNPFIDHTNIKFRIPVAGEVSLVLMNSQGQILLDKTIKASTGENTIVLNRDEFSGSGLFFYQIRYKSKVITKRLII